jgi:predicted acylesterase/phospholipase RssA
MAHAARRRPTRALSNAKAKSGLPGQVVLVLQGGGALGAYQVGVYQALHEAGIEPDWVIGTSIGAINAALICGNPPGIASIASTRSGAGSSSRRSRRAPTIRSASPPCSAR